MNRMKKLLAVSAGTGIGLKVLNSIILHNDHLFQRIVGLDRIEKAEVGEEVSKTILDLVLFGKQIFKYELAFIKEETK